MINLNKEFDDKINQLIEFFTTKLKQMRLAVMYTNSITKYIESGLNDLRHIFDLIK